MKKLLGLILLGFLFSLSANASEAPICRGAKFAPFVFQECMNKIFAKEKLIKCYNMTGTPLMYQSCFNRNLGKMGMIACTQLMTDPFGFETCVNIQLRRRHELNKTIRTIAPNLNGIKEIEVRNPREEEKVVNDSARESGLNFTPALAQQLNDSQAISR